MLTKGRRRYTHPERTKSGGLRGTTRRCYPGATSSAVSNVVYRSYVRLERVKGPIRRAWLPAEREPVTFGVHGAIAEHYNVSSKIAEPHAATLDYIVAAAAG